MIFLAPSHQKIRIFLRKNSLFAAFCEISLFILCRSIYNTTKAEFFFSVFAVALLTESVDRNLKAQLRYRNNTVALLTESVDRNWVGIADNFKSLCRSPHGERG